MTTKAMGSIQSGDGTSAYAKARFPGSSLEKRRKTPVATTITRYTTIGQPHSGICLVPSIQSATSPTCIIVSSLRFDNLAKIGGAENLSASIVVRRVLRSVSWLGAGGVIGGWLVILADGHLSTYHNSRYSPRWRKYKSPYGPPLLPGHRWMVSGCKQDDTVVTA